MKKLCAVLISGLMSVLALGQTQQNQTGDPVNVPAPTPPTIVSQYGNSQVWQWTTYELLPSGQVVPHLHHYTELATGLNYQQNGQWVASQEQINIQPDGTASATAGQHQAYFPADIGSGVIKLVTPDGLTLQSQPVGLSYDDGTNTVLIAELTNSVGQLISSNQVIYTNAFIGVDADLLYTYRKSGFEQDVIFREQPPTPEQFGLNSGNTRMQILTEFFDPPSPAECPGPVNPQDGLQDTTLAFGSMSMIQGKAFLMNTTDSQNGMDQIPVYKSWAVVGGRTLLIEEVPYQRANPQLETLPASTAGALTSLNSTLSKPSAKRQLPPVRLVETTTNAMRFAKNDLKQDSGVVFDYVTMDSSETNFTFQGDTTYYISGSCVLSGATVLEGGTVIKMNGEGELYIDYTNSTISCETAPYRPAIFTSYNDNTVGESISGSSGSPAHGDVSVFIWADNPTNILLDNVRFSYCVEPILQQVAPSYLEVRDCQFYQVNDPMAGYNLGLYNVLVDSAAPSHGQIAEVNGPSFIGEQLTVDGRPELVSANTNTIIALTNCIITTTNSGYTLTVGGAALYTNDVVVLIQPSTPVYQTVGAGNYYLATNSPYRGAGTPNIDPGLLADLAQKTTYPPTVVSNTTLDVTTNFSPQVQRDSNASPDLGYHYDPLDYVFGDGVILNTNAIVNAGTAMGWYEGIIKEGPALTVQQMNINGTATSPCWFVRYNTVQEGRNSNWTTNSQPGPGSMPGSGCRGRSQPNLQSGRRSVQ